jgi:hypothetical protein
MLFLAYKAICFLLISLAIVLLPPIFSVGNYNINVHGPGMSSSPTRYFETWDTQPYLMLGRKGYQTGSAANAWYPLWPFCIRLFSHVTAGSYLAAGLILSNLLSIAALVFLHGYLSRSHDPDIADRTVMLMLAFPGALFLLFPYSESLYLLLCVAVFFLLWKNDYRRAGIVSFFAALTRPVGVLWAIPLAVHIFRNRKMPALIYTVLPVFGYGCYLAIMYLSTGNAFAGFIPQDLFISHASVTKLFDPAGFIRTLTMPLSVHDYLGSAIDRMWFCLFIVSLFPLWKRDKVMFSYTLVMGLVPALTVSLMSFTRYSLMLIPTFIIAADFFVPAARKGLFYLTLAALFGIQIIFLIRHINFYWAG